MGVRDENQEEGRQEKEEFTEVEKTMLELRKALSDRLAFFETLPVLSLFRTGILVFSVYTLDLFKVREV